MSYTDDNLTDRYGSFYLITGLEEHGRCFWCGAVVHGGRRYCNDDHRDKYHEYFYWPDASAAARRKADGHCQLCYRVTDLIVHHIEPLNGTLRTWNILNIPSYLIAVCHSCHGKEHAKITGNLAPPKMPASRRQAELDAGQLLMEPIYSSENMRRF